MFQWYYYILEVLFCMFKISTYLFKKVTLRGVVTIGHVLNTLST
jgi:hypothetical protein